MTRYQTIGDVDAGRIDRRIFTDEAVYREELERVFARSWLFLAHESQIPAPGDFFATYMGADPVLVVRQRDGSVRALLNSCNHRGMKVCRADCGNAKAFTCSYHGWTYGDDGALVGVPFENEAFGAGLPKDELGLTVVPRLESYKGFVFGCWDVDAPDFDDYLGDMAYYFDILADRVAGGTEVVGGVFKWTMRGNWKLASEQFAGDMYHGAQSHASAIMADAQVYGVDDEAGGTVSMLSLEGFQINPGGGHGVGAFERPPGTSAGAMSSDPITAAYLDATREDMAGRLGSARADDAFWVHNTIFPNFSWLHSNGTVRVWHPTGPDTIEVWMWCVVEKSAPAEVKRAKRLDMQRHFGPSGTWEQDDGENWNYCVGSSNGIVQQRRPLTYRAGIGMAREHREFPGEIGPVYSEMNQRALYRRWCEFMDAKDWSEISVPVRTFRGRTDQVEVAAP